VPILRSKSAEDRTVVMVTRMGGLRAALFFMQTGAITIPAAPWNGSGRTATQENSVTIFASVGEIVGA
jgi:hypothetical protein